MKKLFLLFFIPFLFGPAFAQNESARIKHQFEKAPYFKTKSIESLAEYLSEGETNPEQKVLNIYTWLIHNVSAFSNGDKKWSSAKVLKRRKGSTEDLAILFQALCENVGVRSHIVYGYCKGFPSFEGAPLIFASNTWNAVLINDRWELVDVHFGIGHFESKNRPIAKLKQKIFHKPYLNNKLKYVTHRTYNYFMPTAESMVRDHLPADPNWQLLNFPVSIATFQDKSWNGYTYQADSLMAPRTLQSYYDSIANYEFLSPNQYQVAAGENAADFNPNNQLLLALGLSKSVSYLPTGDEEKDREAKEKALDQCKTIIRCAKNQQRLTNVAIKKSNNEQRRINAEFSRIAHKVSVWSSKSIENHNRTLDKRYQRLTNDEERLMQYRDQFATHFSNEASFWDLELGDVTVDSVSCSKILKLRDTLFLSSTYLDATRKASTIKSLLQEELLAEMKEILPTGRAIGQSLTNEPSLEAPVRAYFDIVQERYENVREIETQIKYYQDQLLSQKQQLETIIAQGQTMWQGILKARRRTADNLELLQLENAYKAFSKTTDAIKLESQEVMVGSKSDDYDFRQDKAELQFDLQSNFIVVEQLLDLRLQERLDYNKERQAYSITSAQLLEKWADQCIIRLKKY